MGLNILILGVNGFIGSSLSERILATQPDWSIYGMDVSQHKLEACLSHDRFHFIEGDITINDEWIRYHIQKCDVVLPLVAIATPAVYTRDPLRVFELDFEANLKIIRWCVAYKKRVLFPSTSEVYGMCADPAFDEQNSPLVLGPIKNERWIYSCSKQLMDRVIYAYGEHEGLAYTLFRPFNWIGPKLDSVMAQKEGSARVLSQFISDILHGKNIQLVNGGLQQRSFTYIDDGIDALMKIIENQNNAANGRIFNIGNPHNNVSIKTLAECLLKLIKTYPQYAELANQTEIVTVDANTYYGKGYEDTQHRVPAIEQAKTYLQWEPRFDFETALRLTLDYHLK